MSKKRRKLPVCPNCGYVFDGYDNYCPDCGQENNELNVPFHHFILETFENTVHFDTKFFRTLGLLLFRPGRLTSDYIRGKRARFVPPVRLYVFISFTFFLMLSLFGVFEPEGLNYRQTGSGTSDTAVSVLDNDLRLQKDTSRLRGNFNFTSALSKEELSMVDRMTDKQLDSVLRKNGRTADRFNRILERKLARLINSDGREFVHKLLKNSSLMMFLLMPFFAWIVFLMYRRKKHHYYESLIYSIHLHSFIFFLLILTMLVSLLPVNGWTGLISFILVLLYIFLSLRKVFNQKAFITVMKTLLFLVTYLFTLVFFLILNFFVSFLFY